MNLNEIQDSCKKWTEYNFPNGLPYQPLLGVIEEVGELAHAHLKMEQNIRGITQEDKIDAVGDIIVFLIDYCNKNNINLQNAIEKTWMKASQRDWIMYPKTGVK